MAFKEIVAMTEKWTPLIRSELIPKPKSEIQEIAKKLGRPYKEIKDAFAREDEAECWVNDIYQVQVTRDSVSVWISFRRHDRAPVTDWRHKQEMKNQLVGPECEGLELFPAESRLMDTANQFHLWCYIDPTYRVPLGFNGDRAVSNIEVGGSKQRKIK